MMTARARPEAIVEALGTAWTVFSLYPDPESQPAFRRAVELLQEASGDGAHLDLDSSGFSYAGEPVITDREGAERFAKRCYLHRVEGLAVVAAPSPRDVERLFAGLAKDDATTGASGGIEAELRRDGVVSFSVAQRSLLRVVGIEDAPDRDRKVQQVLDAGVDAAAFAEALIEESGGEPDAVVDLFYGRYHETLDHLTEGDVFGREGVVQTFVEAFFYLDEPAQLAAFRRFLDSDEVFDRAFLDQFAGHELAKLAPRLDSQGLALLLDYARVATDQADGRPDELLGILKNPEALHSVREVAAAKVQERLGELTKAAEESAKFLAVVQDKFPDPRRYFYDSLEVFRGLLAVEDREDRFRRIMRVWVGKVSASVRASDFRRAELWLRSVTAKPTYPPDRQSDVDYSMAQIANPEILNHIVAAAADKGEREAEKGSPEESALRLLQALGPRAVNALIDLLAEEEGRNRRRLLVGLLSRIAAEDPTLIVNRLSDDRWYVVRNLLTVLRETSTATASEAVVTATDHPDGRVRLEALRVLGTADSGAITRLTKAFADDDEKVRHAAIGMMGAAGTAEASRGLVAALEDRRTRHSDKLRIILALGGSDSSAAIDALTGLAKKRFALGGQTRSLRQAAQTALRRRQP
ncbi:MAG: HEAT repeat domain-containing protein [Acidimicrobiia bacterium]|nr:HEAT repeat domain-containing protein [Acidimicrobiia bacterium]MDH5502905.1 HEAT repeat domain-containing protein [Acidimicrobiia bacterium]